MSVEDALLFVLNEERETMADDYIRMNEVLEFVYSYFACNIDDVAGAQIKELTLNELSQILKRKIDHYKKFVRTDTAGVFAQPT